MEGTPSRWAATDLMASMRRLSSPPEAIFEELNVLAQDMIGDIVLDPLTGQIYEEHADALEKAIKSIK